MSLVNGSDYIVRNNADAKLIIDVIASTLYETVEQNFTPFVGILCQLGNMLSPEDKMKLIRENPDLQGIFHESKLKRGQPPKNMHFQ